MIHVHLDLCSLSAWYWHWKSGHINHQSAFFSGAVELSARSCTFGRVAERPMICRPRNCATSKASTAGPWLRSPPTLWRRGLGVSVAMTGTDPASQPASNPLLFWMRNDVVWRVKCLWNVFAKIGSRSQIFGNTTVPQEFKILRIAEVFALDMALSLDLIKINSNK